MKRYVVTANVEGRKCYLTYLTLRIVGEDFDFQLTQDVNSARMFSNERIASAVVEMINNLEDEDYSFIEDLRVEDVEVRLIINN